MADPTQPPAPASGGAGASGGASSPPGTSSAPANAYKAPERNPAFRAMGLPKLPTKLPSRNWLIFWGVVLSVSGAVIYDKREKKRATARWSRAVSHLAKEPMGDPLQMPRRLTIYLESPPGDGLRVAQDHYTEYIKPILAASGLDWEFVQGRQQGDIRAAVAEKIRRIRQPVHNGEELTGDEIVQEVRQKNGTRDFDGMRGDIIIGRHTWKEYVRGLHEGWLGPLSPPEIPAPEVTTEAPLATDSSPDAPTESASSDTEKPVEEKKEPEEKPQRPPQIRPYNTTDDYSTSSVPAVIPTEFSPSTPIVFPHILGFSATFTRLNRFFNRRHLADSIGREVAAVCLATAREYREDGGLLESEQQTALEHEESDWPKSVWKDEKPDEKKDGENKEEAEKQLPKEKIWTNPMVLDSRISTRMRRFELQPEDEARARAIVVPEEEVEGWIKGSLRDLWKWTTTKQDNRPVGLKNVGNLDE